MIIRIDGQALIKVFFQELCTYMVVEIAVDLQAGPIKIQDFRLQNMAANWPLW